MFDWCKLKKKKEKEKKTILDENVQYFICVKILLKCDETIWWWTNWKLFKILACLKFYEYT